PIRQRPLELADLASLLHLARRGMDVVRSLLDFQAVVRRGLLEVIQGDVTRLVPLVRFAAFAAHAHDQPPLTNLPASAGTSRQGSMCAISRAPGDLCMTIAHDARD